jgi:hypothetical protein
MNTHICLKVNICAHIPWPHANLSFLDDNGPDSDTVFDNFESTFKSPNETALVNKLFFSLSRESSVFWMNDKSF